MTYVETSVILAQLLAEDRYPPESLWADPLVSSRLTEYEGMESDPCAWACKFPRRIRQAPARPPPMA